MQCGSDHVFVECHHPAVHSFVTPSEPSHPFTPRCCSSGRSSSQQCSARSTKASPAHVNHSKVFVINVVHQTHLCKNLWSFACRLPSHANVVRKSAFRGNRGHFHYAHRHSASKIFLGVRNWTEMVNIDTIISHVNKVRRRHLSRLQTHQRQPGFQEHLSPAGKVCVQKRLSVARF